MSGSLNVNEWPPFGPFQPFQPFQPFGPGPTEFDRLLFSQKMQTFGFQIPTYSGPLSDQQIRFLIASGQITCFDPEPDNDRAKDRKKRMSHGITHHGIDLRFDDKFRRPADGTTAFEQSQSLPPALMHAFTPTDGETIWGDVEQGDGIHLMPGEFILGQTKEIISIPPWCVGRLEPRSTWLRYGLLIFSSPIEAGWKGRITLEIVNLGPWRLWIPAHEGICQLQFIAGGMSQIDYAAKQGKYMDQHQPTPGIMKESDNGDAPQQSATGSDSRANTTA